MLLGTCLNKADHGHSIAQSFLLQMERAAKMLLHRQLYMAWNAFKDHARLSVLQRQAMMKWTNKALYEVLEAFRCAVRPPALDEASAAPASLR